MSELHLFHIPVLGLGYSIDTPVKVARFGISSVISIMDDELIEKMRQYHSQKAGMTYEPITKTDEDYRAKRITAYLDTVNDIVTSQVAEIKTQPFGHGNEIDKYFETLPDTSPLKAKYVAMKELADGLNKNILEQELRDSIIPGSIDVNIMVKVDKLNTGADGELLPAEYSEASSALRGFANSRLSSSVVLSAGYNPRLYSYLEQFNNFLPDENGHLNKTIILKVSDYRSALVQGKILAKKGLWISEFRIESGLNCGGHAFATEGLLLGPILEDFKNNRGELFAELYMMCKDAQTKKNIPTFREQPEMKITVQGGIGTASEQNFLLDYYTVDRTGWGSPFLLVPEATNVDDSTLSQLATAEKDDYYLSYASPLGVPFNNFRKSSAEKQRKERIDKGRPGSPCYKKHLVSNTEFTDAPICTASRQYQNLKINQLKEQHLPKDVFEAEFNKITEKDCLCEGLGAPALIKDNMPLSHNLSAVTICPGPNLAYFSGTFSLSQMVDHIYGRVNILNNLYRPNMFMNELELYINYLKKELSEINMNPKKSKYFQSFKANLLEGIEYYKKLVPSLGKETEQHIASMKEELRKAVETLNSVNIPAIAK